MGTVGPHSGPKVKDWTILVYGGGVNNLDEAIRKNWDGADDRPLPENVDVFVRHIDKHGKAIDVHMTSEGTTVVEAQTEPVDSSAPETLGDFFSDGVRRHPAKRFLAVVSSHGKGAEGVIEDERARRLMSPQGFKAALDVGAAANGGRPIDAVLFDACRMAAMEMACQMVGSATVAIASMDNIASVGYSLAEVVESTRLSGDAHDLGRRLVHNDAPQPLSSCLTLAAIDLDRLEPLQKAIGCLAEEFRSLDPDSARTVRRVSESARRNTASPDAWKLLDMLSDHVLATHDPHALQQWLESVQPGPAVALVSFCQDLLDQEPLLTGRPALRDSLQAVIKAHDQAVFAARASDQNIWPGGLTVSLPLASTAAPLYGEGSDLLSFEKSTGWSRAVEVLVPPGVPANHRPTWLEEELENSGSSQESLRP